MSETSHTYFESGKRAILITSLANIYVVFLQFLYSLSKKGEIEMKELRDLEFNKGFSEVSVMDDE